MNQYVLAKKNPPHGHIRGVGGDEPKSFEEQRVDGGQSGTEMTGKGVGKKKTTGHKPKVEHR